MAMILARGTLMYLGAVNAGSAGLFAYDKAQAARGGWRVSEKRLCQSALVGGWAGGLMAMQLFRHKTRKKSFQRKYVSAMATNAIALVPTLLLMSLNPVYRFHFGRTLGNFLRSFGGKQGPKRNPPRNRR